eukprot:1119330-Alexandrium_andersonii.AAC.1
MHVLAATCITTLVVVPRGLYYDTCSSKRRRGGASNNKCRKTGRRENAPYSLSDVSGRAWACSAPVPCFI